MAILTLLTSKQHAIAIRIRNPSRIRVTDRETVCAPIGRIRTLELLQTRSVGIETEKPEQTGSFRCCPSSTLAVRTPGDDDGNLVAAGGTEYIYIDPSVITKDDFKILFKGDFDR